MQLLLDEKWRVSVSKQARTGRKTLTRTKRMTSIGVVPTQLSSWIGMTSNGMALGSTGTTMLSDWTGNGKHWGASHKALSLDRKCKHWVSSTKFSLWTRNGKHYGASYRTLRFDEKWQGLWKMLTAWTQKGLNAESSKQHNKILLWLEVWRGCLTILNTYMVLNPTQRPCQQERQALLSWFLRPVEVDSSVDSATKTYWECRKKVHLFQTKMDCWLML